MSPITVRYAAVALLLGALLGGTYALQAWETQRIKREGAAAQAAAVRGAVGLVRAEVRALERDLLRRAEALARSGPVRAALLGEPGGRAAVVRHFGRLNLPEGVTAELYTPTPDLVAWKGPAFPLDPATRTTRFLDTLQTAVVSDGQVRRALVLWLPVREGGRVIGAVRLLRLLEARVPVRNQYLRDYAVADRWRDAVGVPVAIGFGAIPAAEVPTFGLLGLDGTPLGWIAVPTPSPAVLQRAARVGYGHAIAFWVMLLLGWGFFGVLRVLAALQRRAEDVRTPGAWAVAAAAAAGAAALWVGLRYVLLALDVPARWFAVTDLATGGVTGGVLFDPTFLGSGVLGGIAGSVGELLVTALFAAALGGGWLRFAISVLRWGRGVERVQGEPRRPGWAWFGLALAGAAVGVGLVAAHAILVRRAVLDATLAYFDRAGPLPEGMVMLVFGALLLLALGVVLTLTGTAAAVRVRGAARLLGGALAVAVALGAAYALAPLAEALPPAVAVAYFGVAAFGAWGLERGPDRWAWPLTLRGTLLAVFLLALLTYPLLYGAAAAEEEAWVEDAAEEFADGEDARVAFALEGVLLDARGNEAIREAFARAGEGSRPTRDSLATDLVTGSLLAALGDYTVGLAFLSPAGDTLGRYVEAPPPGAESAFFTPPDVRQGDPLSFRALRRRSDTDRGAGFVVEREPAPEGRGKYRYAGAGPVRDEAGRVLGWVVARAEPKPVRYVSETPFPRVLVPAGLYTAADGEVAFAEFRGGVAVRTRGGDFGRFRLPEEVGAALAEREALWRRERVEGRPARVYYRRLGRPGGEAVVAVRVPPVGFFDHLYFYLRLALPGLALGLALYLGGVPVRRRAGVYPQRVRLRDRVLNRFFLVSIATVAVTGLIGQEVIVEQNRQAIEETLKRRLSRVEAELFAEAMPEGRGGLDGLDGGQPLYRVLDRARPDVVGPRLGLDINLYRGAELVSSSRSQLVRQRLIDRRLPVGVYEALFVDGQRYAFAEEEIGSFSYTTGYEALPDDAGRPGAVIAVPTLPEQLAIEADQARMIAYLFGVLLLLLLGIFLLTTLLANRLTRPFRRLRAGLLAVGAGEDVAEPIPVESRDEVGELIETFNAMRHQLEESRRKLSAQERELAWREMARQVAHEIKNPLTPMKLSVQHLRRAYHERPPAAEDGRFGPLLERISATLIEQIDALSRIAGEFSSFARLPRRHLARLDLREVVREAAALIGEEDHARIVLDLAEEPLPVVADREELRRVYINLLKNALQAMPEDEVGTVTVRAEREAGPEGPRALSAVRDTGTGIPDEARDRVFRPNFSTKTSGMGLGLAITRKAVEDLRGEVWFETEVGVGTTFFVRLPLADDDAGGGPAGALHGR